MFPLLIVLSSDMFHFLTIVKLPRESIVKTRSNTEAVCNTFLGTATDSNCRRIWLKDDSRVHILLTTDIGPLKLFSFLTHSLKVYCVARKDPRTNFVEKPGSTTRSGRSMISSNGSEQSRKALSSLSTVKEITAHDSSDNGTDTLRNRLESGGTKNATVRPVDHDKNPLEDSALFEGPNLGNELLEIVEQEVSCHC